MKLLIVDDHSLFCEGLSLILSRLVDGVSVIEAGSVEAGLEIVGTEPPDLILLDLQLPGMHGFDGIEAFRKICPDASIVFLSGLYDEQTVREGLLRGARGFIPKALSAQALLSALRSIIAGEIWIPQECDTTSVSEPASGVSTGKANALTPRQADVLALLREGHSNKEIGKALRMSENTVRCHVAAIFRALGAKSRTEAALLARRHGL